MADRSNSKLDTPARRPGPMGELLAYISARSSSASSYPELAEIDYFRGAWARARTARLLHQSHARVPENAGPLNSSNLAHRSLSLMREQSPEYLHHFLAYLDALSWMEQLNRGGPPKKGGRGKSR